MLTVDFSLKVLHIAVNSVPQKKGRALLHKGIIFLPQAVFSKINECAEDEFSEFFLPHCEYKLTCMNTEMGVGELARIFGKRFGVDCSMWIGGIIAPFTIKSANLERFWEEITKAKQKQFLVSEEKKIFTSRPILGFEVKT